MKVEQLLEAERKLHLSIVGLAEYLVSVLEELEEDTLQCPVKFLDDGYMDCWHLEKIMYTGVGDNNITTYWNYSMPYEDWDDDDTWHVPKEWLQMYLDNDLEGVKQAFLKECREFTDKEELREAGIDKRELERIVELHGKAWVLEELK